MSDVIALVEELATGPSTARRRELVLEIKVALKPPEPTHIAKAPRQRSTGKGK